MRRVPVFDLDGTLLDSDNALVAPFVALGVPAEAVPFGMPLVDACEKLGVTVEDYIRHYDSGSARPFAGVAELLSGLDRWAIFSNKLGLAGELEIRALGWQPELAMFSESFGGPKTLSPVLQRMQLDPRDVICVGDSEHDRLCAQAAGVDFALAGWNPRVVSAEDDIVLSEPRELLDLL